MKYIMIFVTLSILVSCSDTVYICSGRYSKRYHKTASCEGLRNCGGKIEKVSKEAIDSTFRTPCHICYSIKERTDEK